MSKGKPKAYSYLRFSTPEQKKGDSKRRQAELAAKYCKAHGLELDTELRLHDLGVSAFRGKNLAAGALGQFLKAAEQGIVQRGSYLLVESLDRLSRDAAFDAQLTLQNIINQGVTVVTLLDGEKVYSRDALVRDPFGLVYAIMVFIRANEESATKSRRLKEAWHGKRLKISERALTKMTPGWIELDKNRKPVLIEERAKIVRRIVKDFMRGMGKMGITRALNEEGVPTFGRNGRRAKHWHWSYMNKILRSPALVGTFIPHIDEYRDGKKRHRVAQDPIENYFPAVINRDTYERLQGLLGRSPLRGRHARAPMSNILSGLARCPRCDSSMSRVSKGPTRKAGKPYLVCSRARVGAGCEYRGVPCESVEKALLERYQHILADMPHPDASIESELTSARESLSALEDRITELLALLERQPSDALAKKVAELEATHKQQQARFDELASRAAQTESRVIKLRSEALGVAMRARPVNRERMNAALRELLKAVVIDYTTGHLVFRWMAGGESSLMFTWPRHYSED